MNQRKKIERFTLLFMVITILSIPLYLHVRTKGYYNSNVSEEVQYVGKKVCVECHISEYNQWQGSHHDKAMEPATEETVLGDFNNQIIKYNGFNHRVYKQDHRFFVETDGDDGTLQEFQIKYTFGYYPLQQYLVEMEKGRMQVLPITWNSKDSVWYHMAEANYPDEVIDHSNWLHWTNQAQNWNGMCADCHSTNLQKNYDFETDSFHTTWSEVDVSCEACHGPASKHLEWAAKADYARRDDVNYGLTVKTSGVDNYGYTDICMRCHARRSAIGDYHHNKDIYNHSIPDLPIPEDFYVDGQILNEDYVYASFTQSKMYMRDVNCNNCHNVHSTEQLFDDNRLCTQCHRADDYNTYNHHFHKTVDEKGESVIADDGVEFEVGEGSRCVNCHMPAQFYMGVDYRNDHSFRIPRPDLSDQLGSPNACNQCHANKSTKWAISYINKWYGISRLSNYGIVFKEAQQKSPKGLEGLKRIYADEVYSEMIRATALYYLGTYYQKESKAILIDALSHINSHIRYNALRVLLMDDDQSFRAVLYLLSDPTKAIRIECASKLSAVDKAQIPSKYYKVLEKANRDYISELNYNADSPIGKLNLANYYMNHHQLKLADKFYKEALKQDNELHIIKVNLAMLYNSQGRYNKAEILFKDYLLQVPSDGNTTFSYALFLSERQRYDESFNLMLKADKLLPFDDRIKYNIAMMYDFEKNYLLAETYLKKAILINRNSIDYHVALMNLYLKYQHNEYAVNTASYILEHFPDYSEIRAIESVINLQ